MTYVDSLARERGFYLAKGQADRVKLVDAELARLGFECDANGALGPLSEKPKTKRAPKERAVAQPAPERAVDKD